MGGQGFAGLQADQIRQADVDAYAAARLDPRPGAREVGPGTVKKELTALKSILSAAGVTPRWRIPPISHHPRWRMVRTPEEVAALWQRLSVHSRRAVGLCLLAGLRAAEAYRADASWLRRDQHEIWVPVRKTSEWNRTALVPTLAELLPSSGPLVTASRNSVDAELRRHSRALGLLPPYRGPGAFRHHCATWAVDLGFTTDDVRLVLAHASGSVTDRYVHSQAVARKRTVLEAVEQHFLAALEAAQ